MKHNETTIRVLYKDTDQMGVAYYANYFVWFEIGRTEFLRDLGMTYKDLEQNSIFLPVTEAYCKYRYPARYDEELRVVTRLNMLEQVRLGFYYELIRVYDGRALAEGETTHAFVNEKGKPVVLRKQNPFLWKILLEKVQENIES